MNCYICNNTATITQTNADSKLFNCPRCGKFYISGSMESYILDRGDKSNYYKVSSWIREQNDEFNNTPTLDNFDEILEIREKTIQEKFDLMMLFLKECPENIELRDVESYWITMSHLGVEVDEDIVSYSNLILLKSWIKDYSELLKFASKAIENNLLIGEVDKGINYFGFNHLTFDGLQYLESLDQPNKSSRNIFVAFNFSDELNTIFNTHVKKAIEELGFNYIIVNQNSTEHNRAISDEIIAKLKSSRIVIADFTNHRNSVYFEAGFAMGMKIPIIWTCQEGHEDDLSFDTRQYPHLIWRDGEDLRKQVSDRIQVII